jgi:hypothetical protein
MEELDTSLRTHITELISNFELENLRVDGLVGPSEKYQKFP